MARRVLASEDAQGYLTPQTNQRAVYASVDGDPTYETPLGQSRGTYGTVGGDDDEAGFGFEQPYASTMGTKHQVYAGLLEGSIDPNVTREMAEKALRREGMYEGNFVIRPSKSHPGSYVFTVACRGEFKNYPVEALEEPYDGMFSVICPGKRRRFKGLGDAVDFYSKDSEGIATKLTKRVIP